MPTPTDRPAPTLDRQGATTNLGDALLTELIVESLEMEAA